MRVELCQSRNGSSASCARSMKSSERASRSSSTVSIRLRVIAGVLDRLVADTAEARILRRIIDVRRLAVQHSTGLEKRHRRMVVRVVGLLGLVLGVQVIEVAVELVEAVDGR